MSLIFIAAMAWMNTSNTPAASLGNGEFTVVCECSRRVIKPAGMKNLVYIPPICYVNRGDGCSMMSASSHLWVNIQDASCFGPGKSRTSSHAFKKVQVESAVVGKPTSRVHTTDAYSMLDVHRLRFANITDDESTAVGMPNTSQIVVHCFPSPPHE